MLGDQIERIRKAEAARIARWFRDGEHGLLYFDRKGRAISISDSEHVRWSDEALRRIDTYVADLERSPKEVMLLGVCVVAAAFFLKTALAGILPMFKDLQPMMFAMPACFWPIYYELSFRRDQHALRGRIEDRLIMRTPLGEEVATRSRRYNVFAIAQGVTAGGAVLVAALALFRGDPGFGTLAMFAFLALAWLFSWAAQRVDATHRRTLW